jgi:hypothetical protein
VNFERLFLPVQIELPDTHSRRKTARSNFRYVLKSSNPVQPGRLYLFPERTRLLGVRRLGLILSPERAAAFQT